jgi:hypothetical protein
MMNMEQFAPIKSQAGVILDAVLHGRPDIAASIIADGIAFYSAARPVKADTVAEFMNDTQTAAKRQNGAKNGKSRTEPKARKPRASKAKKAAKGVSA